MILHKINFVNALLLKVNHDSEECQREYDWNLDDLDTMQKIFMQSQELKLIKAHYGLAGGELKKPLNRIELAFKWDIFMIKVPCGRPTERENTKHD